ARCVHIDDVPPCELDIAKSINAAQLRGRCDVCDHVRKTARTWYGERIAKIMLSQFWLNLRLCLAALIRSALPPSVNAPASEDHEHFIASDGRECQNEASGTRENKWHIAQNRQ